MFMGKQMILTIFIISIAFGTETELQIRIIQFCPSTNCTFVACDVLRLLHLTVIGPLPVYFLWRYTAIIACTEEENQEIQNRCYDRNSATPAWNNHAVNDQCCIKTCHPFHFNRDNEPEHDSHIRITHCKCQENCHINVIRAETGTHWYRCIYAINHIQK